MGMRLLIMCTGDQMIRERSCMHDLEDLLALVYSIDACSASPEHSFEERALLSFCFAASITGTETLPFSTSEHKACQVIHRLLIIACVVTSTKSLGMLLLPAGWLVQKPGALCAMYCCRSHCAPSGFFSQQKGWSGLQGSARSCTGLKMGESRPLQPWKAPICTWLCKHYSHP